MSVVKMSCPISPFIFTETLHCVSVDADDIADKLKVNNARRRPAVST